MRKKKGYGASLTVEASLAVPAFFYAVLALCCLFLYMEARAAIGEAMLETAREISVYGDLIAGAEEKAAEYGSAAAVAADIAGGEAVRLLVCEKLKNSPAAVNAVVGGTGGISFAGSEYCTSDESIKLVCSYELKAPVPGFGPSGIKSGQEIVYRYFTGTKAESLLEEKEEEHEEKEETVFVTENGTVYHVKLTCPSLKLNILSVLPADIPAKRNEYGAKYYPCERCAKGDVPETVFITTDGDRYHYRLDCAGLKRTIREIGISKVGDLRKCKRCGDKKD